MAKDWSQYEIKDFPMEDKWAKYEIPSTPETEWEMMQRKNPILSKAGEYLAGTPFGEFMGRHPGPAQFAKGASQFLESSGVPQFGAGMAEGAHNSIASTLNSVAKPLGYAVGQPWGFNHLETGNQFEDSGLAHTLGDVAGRIATLGGPTKMAAQQIGRLPGYLQPAAGLLGGGAEGIITGENAEGERWLPGVLGALTGGTAASVKPAADFIKKGLNSTDAKIFEKVMKNMNQKVAESNKLYGKVEENVAKRGITEIKPPKDLDIATMFQSASAKEKKSLNKFLENPTFKNAHEAQSDLGKMNSRLGNLGSQTSIDQNAAEAARNAQRKIKQSIYQTLKENKSSDLADAYRKAGKDYKEVLKYTHNPYIEKYMSGEMRPKTLSQKLGKHEKFLTQLGPEFPEFETQKILKKMMQGTMGAGGLGGAGYLYNKVSRNNYE